MMPADARMPDMHGNIPWQVVKAKYQGNRKFCLPQAYSRNKDCASLVQEWGTNREHMDENQRVAHDGKHNAIALF